MATLWRRVGETLDWMKHTLLLFDEMVSVFKDFTYSQAIFKYYIILASIFDIPNAYFLELISHIIFRNIVYNFCFNEILKSKPRGRFSGRGSNGFSVTVNSGFWKCVTVTVTDFTLPYRVFRYHFRYPKSVTFGNRFLFYIGTSSSSVFNNNIIGRLTHLPLHLQLPEERRTGAPKQLCILFSKWVPDFG